MKETLNTQQTLAATFEGKHLLVLAGAGTGKTRTIIARARHLIESGVHPSRILILSFTRKSAAEIVERIGAQLSENQAEGLTGMTFHSWCMSVIKNNPHIFPQAGYTLLDEDDQQSCIKLLCGRDWKHRGVNDRNIKPEQILDVYSYMANARCSLSEAIRMKLYDNAPATLDVQDDNNVLKGVISMYIDYKRKRKYMDYDDILLTVSQYLSRHAGLRAAISGMYDHILIDEMQDTNPLQYELLKSFQDNCHLFCVGDDAQSIYGFRGADFSSIHRFTDVVPDSEVCRLTINYRSTQEILNLANWVLRSEKHCEYAVLVSTLEADSELYNEGIVDVSYRFPKMLVIRPQFFMAVISLLSRTARRGAEQIASLSRDLEIARAQTVDVSRFEQRRDKFVADFGKLVEAHLKKQDDALAGIDKAIEAAEKQADNLRKIRALFEASGKKLIKANEAAENDFTIKKLCHGNPTMRAKFDEARRKASESE